MGGNDQWSKMLGGADLIRRKEQQSAFACTFQLLLTHDGRKMGKTEAGALWLDPNKTSPFDFYQYWRNVDDKDVDMCLRLLTFLPMDEIRRLNQLQGSEINQAKRILALEVTRLVHGEEAARQADDAAQSLFGGAGQSVNVPSFAVTDEQLGQDGRITTLLVLCGLCKSGNDARTQVKAGAVSIDGEKVTDPMQALTAEQIPEEGLLLKKGKKGYCRLLRA